MAASSDFPSWHDGSMFCMAAVLDDYEGHWIGYPLYIFAGLIGFSRIDTRDHNLSDVLFGGVLGYVIGKSVSGKALPEMAECGSFPGSIPSRAASAPCSTCRSDASFAKVAIIAAAKE